MAITPGQKPEFLFGTNAQFSALKEANKVNDNYLYFLTDTKQIYVGSNLYTGQVTFVESFPETPSQGIIYVNATTHETKVWNGTAWQVIIPAISNTLDENTENTNLVTAKAIKDFINDKVTDAVVDLAYDETTQKFTITYGDETTSNLELKALLTGAAYNSETGDFTFTVANGEAITINTPKENFLSSASYDNETHMLTLTLADDTEVEVNLEDLVDVYTVKSGATITLTLTDGELTAEVKKSETEGNALVLNEDGLFVPEALIKAIADTDTINLINTDGELTAEVKISEDEQNQLTTKTDGLFVAPTDLSNYYTKDEVDKLGVWKEISLDNTGEEDEEPEPEVNPDNNPIS